MNDVPSLLAILFGSLAGLLHARLLWLGSQRLSGWSPMLGLVRVAVVGVCLTLAAVTGQLLTAAAAWFVSFLGCAIVVTVRAANGHEDRSLVGQPGAKEATRAAKNL